MKVYEILNEDGRIVKGVNTTVDVGVGQIPIEASKFGNSVDKDGKPPTLSSKVKGKSTNVLFNLGLTEGVMLKFQRGEDFDTLHIKPKGKNRVELRGKPGYERGNYDAQDKLHQVLDNLGKAANFAELMNGETVSINPNHPDGKRANKTAQDILSTEAWSEKYKRSINCNNPKGFSQKAHCAGRKKTNETTEEEYKNLINQYFRKGWGFDLGGGATYKMMWHELKAARRWLAQAVKAGEIEPGVDIAQDLTIRDRNGLEVGQPGHLTIKAAAALDKARNMANAAGKKLSSGQVDNITNKHNTDAEAQRDFSENFADGKKNEAASPQMDPKAVEFEMLRDAEKRRLAGEYKRIGPQLAITTWGAGLAQAVANYLGAQHLSALERVLVKQGLKLATENFADGEKK